MRSGVPFPSQVPAVSIPQSAPLLTPEMLNTPALQTLDLWTSLGILIGGLVT